MKKKFFFVFMIGLNSNVAMDESFPPTTWYCAQGDLVVGYCYPIAPGHPDGDVGLQCFKNRPDNGLPCSGSVGVFDSIE